MVDGAPRPASVVEVKKPQYSEMIAELSRSFHVEHKSGTGHHLNLLSSMNPAVFRKRNFICGQEFEAFNNKGPVIESGYNTLNSNISLRMEFTGLKDDGVNAQDAMNCRVFCM